MSKVIVVAANPRGIHSEGIASETGIKPGHLVRRVPGQDVDDTGRSKVELWDGAAAGERDEILVADIGWEGQTEDDAYALNDRVRLYSPCPSEKVRVRVKSGVTLTYQGKLIAEANTGELIATTGTPESEPFKSQEAGTADGSPVLCIATGA